MKIKYENKVGVAPSGDPVNTWSDDDCNEVKDVVNENDTTAIETGSTVMFDKLSGGKIYGDWNVPITGDITVDVTEAQETACIMIIFSGYESPKFIGVDVADYSGEITLQGVYTIYVQYVFGKINVNVFNVAGDPRDFMPPEQMTFRTILPTL